MGYCRKWIFRNILPWLITLLAFSMMSFAFAMRLPGIDENLNKLYEQQALEMGSEKPQMVANSEDAILFLTVMGIVFLLAACFMLSKYVLPHTSRMGKSLLRYAKYENEGTIQELLRETEADLTHAAVFGDIAIGKIWIAGRSFPPGGQAIRLSRVCALYYTAEKVTRYAPNIGTTIGTTWYHLYLFDEKKRQTELLTPRESDLMGAYHALLRRNPSLLHGGKTEYDDFICLPNEKQEYLLYEVARKTYEQTYY